MLKTALTLLSLALLVTSASADQQLFYGIWGTNPQCSRTLITPKGTKKAAPFEISKDWLGHGDIWCRLRWSGVHSTPGGVATVVRAICGEDDTRNYHIKFDLSDNELTLTWNQSHVNGPLKRCPA